MKRETVSVYSVDSTSHLHAQVTNGINSLGDLKLNSDSIVAIKPNLCCVRSWETGATTDPRVVESIVRLLKDQNMEYEKSTLWNPTPRK